MSKVANIGQIYMGQIDAKDELNYGTEQKFLESFVMPPNFNINELLDTHKFIVNGFKGVGKTALLYFLESHCIQRDHQTCTSFMLFKSEYKDIEKNKIDNIAKRIIQSIDFEKKSMTTVKDFSDIWKMIIFQKIVDDHKEYSDNLFVNDENWSVFEKQVTSIRILNMSNSMVMKPRKFKMFQSYNTEGVSSTGVEVDFEKELDYKTISLFSEKVNEVTRLFYQLKRTDIPYYLFIDELEAFYEDSELFKRDLTMLRDLILTVKDINYLIESSNKDRMKLICSVRTEIINSIHRFIPTKELNKAISGFECKLNWNYFNNIAVQHPLFQILLKRLEATDVDNGIAIDENYDVFKEWFVENKQTDRIVNHILNSLWNKPRDVIRLISAMKSSPSAGNNKIHQDVINQSIKEYSNKSLVEICGELNALYNPNQIDVFLTLLRGFKSPFSVSEFKDRIKSFSSIELFFKDINIEVLLSDLYRVGILGNYNPYLGKHRWQHKNDDEAIIDEGWLFTIHNGLNSSLAIVRSQKSFKNGERVYYDFDSKALKPNHKYSGEISKILKNIIFVDIQYNDRFYKGALHVSNVSDDYIYDLNEMFHVGDKVQLKVINYDKIHKSWNSKLVK